MNLLKMYTELNKLYKGINDFYYSGTLPEAVITIQSKKVLKSDSWGWATQNAWIDVDGKKYYELNITAEYLDYDINSIAATMNHEMVHIYCWENGIVDTAKGGRYHKKVFKDIAEERGLIIEKAPSIGFSITKPSEEFCEFVKLLEIEPVFGIKRNTPSETKAKKPRQPRPKYECPMCGAIVRGKAGLKINCVDCGCEFAYIESPAEND